MMFKNFAYRLNIELDPYDLDGEKDHPIIRRIERFNTWQKGGYFFDARHDMFEGANQFAAIFDFTKSLR